LNNKTSTFSPTKFPPQKTKGEAELQK